MRSRVQAPLLLQKRARPILGTTVVVLVQFEWDVSASSKDHAVTLAIHGDTLTSYTICRTKPLNVFAINLEGRIK